MIPYYVLLAFLAGTSVPLATQVLSHLREPKTKIGLVSLKGTLSDAAPYITPLRELFQDNSVKGIVLLIDSPGGTTGTCQALFHELLTLKQKHPKPVGCYIENIAASGGYYCACACDYIIASPGAVIGSIGCYFEQFNIHKVLQHFHISYENESAGRYKMTGSPFLASTAEGKAQLQALAENSYKQFVKDVAQRRPTLPEDSNVWAEGRLFTGEQASSLGLIDGAGSPTTSFDCLRAILKTNNRLEFVQPRSTQGIISTLLGLTEGSFLKSCIQSTCEALEERYSIPKS